MTLFDLALLCVCAIFTLLGAYWGTLRQVLAVVGVLVGLVVAGRFGGVVAGWLSSFIADTAQAQILGFLLTLAAVSVAASLIASLLRLFVGLLFLGWLDHLLGGALGFIQALFIVVALMIAARVFPVAPLPQLIRESPLTTPLQPLSEALTFLPR